jgi:hypothetical protein
MAISPFNPGGMNYMPPDMFGLEDQAQPDAGGLADLVKKMKMPEVGTAFKQDAAAKDKMSLGLGQEAAPVEGMTQAGIKPEVAAAGIKAGGETLGGVLKAKAEAEAQKMRDVTGALARQGAAAQSAEAQSGAAQFGALGKLMAAYKSALKG